MPTQEREPIVAPDPALLWVGNHVDRVRMNLPRSSVERFESLARTLHGLRRAFRVGDINSVLKALKWMPVGAEQSLEEADTVCGHDDTYFAAANTSTAGPAADY
jgi:hypothetical protein